MRPKVMLGENAPKVCIVGLGYIGLPTAAVLADRGYLVHGVDIRRDVVETINRGEIHIHEPGLGELVHRVVQGGKLRASLEPCEADIFFICVPTPINEDKSPDLSYIEAASSVVRPFIKAGNLVILESTSPPCTTQKVVVKNAIPADLQVGKDVFVAYCPERVLPGRILIEVIENDRIVGGITPACTQRVKQFYETFVRGAVLTTNAVTAEVTKLVENAFRDVNIAFANELSMLADHLGADPFEVIELANRHPRVSVLRPGPGVGGHCISVDPWFLAHAAPQHSSLIRTARHVNDAKPQFVVTQVCELARRLETPVIGCLGLTYKPDVDDLRESPSLEIARRLRESNCGEVAACDPYIKQSNCGGIVLMSLAGLLRRSNIIVLLTDHEMFRGLTPQQLAGKHIIDTRGIWHAPAGNTLGIDLPGAPQIVRSSAFHAA